VSVASAGQTADPKTDAEVERIRALVNAGALPRRALPEAEQSLEKSRLAEVLRKTLTKRDLTEAELPAMLAPPRRQADTVTRAACSPSSAGRMTRA
jgi:hypothetical protein